MANICSTLYTIKAPTSVVNKLNNIMENIENENDIELGVEISRDLKHLIRALGGDPGRIYCRGFWQSRELKDENTLDVFVESAWCRCHELDCFIKGLFPSAKIYWEEETEDGYLTTNDRKREIFTTRYIFNPEDLGGDDYIPFTECRTDEELVNVANRFFGTEETSVDIIKNKIYEYIETVDEHNEEYRGELEFLESHIKRDNLLD